MLRNLTLWQWKSRHPKEMEEFRKYSQFLKDLHWILVQEDSPGGFCGSGARNMLIDLAAHLEMVSREYFLAVEEREWIPYRWGTMTEKGLRMLTEDDYKEYE